MAKYQVTYQRRDVEDNVVKGTVVYQAAHLGIAVDWAAAELEAEEDTKSFVILNVKEV